MNHSRQQKIIELANERNEIQSDESGYQAYWPSRGGYLTAFDLRAIADELDRQNMEWHAQVCTDLAALEKSKLEES